MKKRGEQYSWTDLRVQVQKEIDKTSLDIRSLNIHEWPAIEYRIMKHFANDERFGFNWMWENRIDDSFDYYAKEIFDFELLKRLMLKSINNNEYVWLFLEDSYRQKSKFWGYSGKISSIMSLLDNLPLCDYYIVSKKLKWVTGQNHHDILFGYGEIARKFREIIDE
ncbi:DUF6756 family protein [Listeria seeligeri]|uniref:DUF6756 family protein n=1 Tax=Listeria seeligeri TaxID=1640 RepID=UPI0022EC0FD9|nr:DUF6756 family protein [Listeria seeligeri]